MKSKKFLLTLLVMLSAIALSGCTATSLLNSWPGLSADAEQAYLANGPSITAIRLSDHSTAWTFPEETDANQAFFGTPALGPDNLLVIGSAGNTHILYGLDTQTGNQRWSFKGAKGQWMGSALVTEQTVYAPNSDGKVYALNHNGQLQWVFDANQHNAAGPIWARPVYDGKLLYVGSLMHKVFAIDVTNGNLVWEKDLGGAIAGSPTLVNNTLLVGSFSKEIVALDAETGAIKWERETENWVWFGPAADENNIYFGDMDGNISALDIATGNHIWPAYKTDAPVVGRGLLLSDLVIFAAESGAIYGFDYQGRTVWTHTIDGKVYTSPVMSGDLILIAPTEADVALIALDTNGRQAWTYKPER